MNSTPTTTKDRKPTGHFALKRVPCSDLTMRPSLTLIVIALAASLITPVTAVTCYGSTSCPNGGTCTEVDFCTCTDAFFSPRCEACRPIANCPEVFCTNFYNSICTRCDGDFGPLFGSAYRKTADQRRCFKQCSWRLDSNACFPGFCTNSECTCSSGFGGPDCRTMGEDQAPILSELRVTLIAGESTVELGGDQNSKLYTDVGNFSHIRVNWKTSYQPVGLPNPGELDADGMPIYPYISDVRLGVVSAVVKGEVHLASGGTLPLGVHECPGVRTQDDPATRLVVCEYMFSVEHDTWTPASGDVLRYDVESESGGIMILHDRDQSTTVTRYYNGGTSMASLNFTFDLEGPYHCLNVTSDCRTTMLNVGNDVTTQPNITVSWKGWADDLSGIEEYHLEVRQMSGARRDEITEIFDSPALYSGVVDSGHSVALPHLGVYSVVLSVHDKAGNTRLSRRFVFYDDDPNDITIQQDFPIHVLSVDSKTHIRCLTDLSADGSIRVFLDWQNHFINPRHHNQMLLKAIGPYISNDIETEYDKNFGQRGRDAVNNTRGITHFRVLSAIDHSGGRSTLNVSSHDSHWRNEATNTGTTFVLNVVDGDSIRFWVEAKDIADHVARDNVLIHADSSPPFIQAGGLNLAPSDDIDGTSVSFETYDIHSGIRTMEWRIFENESNTEVELARQSLPPVTVDQDSKDCVPTRCMCTPAGVCYATQYTFNPNVHIAGRASGYYATIKVTNQAGLVTSRTIKVTVDTSPPEAGAVHDGMVGSRELDFQQSFDLSGHWEGFTDEESGISFYHVLFDRSCWEDPLRFASFKNNMTRTTSNHANWRAPTSGKYFITVVAYNSAEESSAPACSDGVTVDTSPPDLSQISINEERVWPGLAKDAEGEVWFINERREKMKLVNASDGCSSKATLVEDLSIYPEISTSQDVLLKDKDDTGCLNKKGIDGNVFLATHKHINVFWNGEDKESFIFDYEIGLSSDPSNPFPDLVAFTSTSGHDHFAMYHPHISQGSVFYLVIKAINGAQLFTVKVVGPIFVDTTPPTFVGRVLVRVDDEYLVAEWGDRGFVDDEDTSLAYQVGIGSTQGGTETLAFQTEKNLTLGPCVTRTSCAALSLDELGWHLHGNHEYYVSVRAQNGAGLTTIGTSPVYLHIVQLPSRGVVLDVGPMNEDIQMVPENVEDIDVQKNNNSISARWFGFTHPHLDIHYEIAVGTRREESSDISGGFIDVGNATYYRLEGLKLTSLTTYYVTVRATSVTGCVNVTSDGVKVIPEGLILAGASIKDGLGCNMTGNNAAFLQPCEDDITYQTSTSDISAYWTIPLTLQPFVTEVFWTLEQETQINFDTQRWIPLLERRSIGMTFHYVTASLELIDGVHIRSKVTFCHVDVCFRALVSNGLWILSEPPEAGRILASGLKSVGDRVGGFVSFQPFIHEYVLTDDQSGLMDYYEWSIVEEDGRVFSRWKPARPLMLKPETAAFTASSSGILKPTSCYWLLVRGFNKVGLSAITSTRLADCAAPDASQIVIDADDEINLERNGVWPHTEKDFVSSFTKLHAVWPKLRHGRYVWSAIEDIGITQFGNLDHGLQFPCSHPLVIACGETENNYVNIGDLSLTHGRHYRVCIHANSVVLQHETWNQTLPPVSSCSDGVTIDTVPPRPGSAWIGSHSQHQHFQRSSSELVIHWQGFTDSDERESPVHHSGIKYYEYAIGSFRGGDDVKSSRRLGIANNVILNNLRLQNGHSYYATIRATDFVDLSAQVTTDSVIIDITPPVVNSSHPLNTGGSILKSTTFVTASWKNTFHDQESGIAYYEWAVGSQAGYADIMAFARVNSEYGESDLWTPLLLQEGHSYFITIKAVNRVQLITLKSFGAFLVDASPPLAGHVLDGDKAQAPANHRDRDFQKDRTVISAFWEGFHEPHSSLIGYSWKVGTCSGCDDIVSEQDVGLKNSVRAGGLNLVSGLTYYVTVKACNSAMLCTFVTSDGVTLDDSPPVPGRVYDGSPGNGDIGFQSSSIRLSAYWWGFHDPHCSISHYEWRAGTEPGADDILRTTRIELVERTLTFLSASNQIPIGTDIYTTVRAYNRLGLWSENSSNGFRVDPSPPTVVEAPAVDEGMGVIIPNTQVLRDVLRILWKFDDPESGVKHQYISVTPHHNGYIDIPTVGIAGSERSYTFTNLTLHDGNQYLITVVACNYAGLCTDAKAEPLLVDASQPTRGCFTLEGTSSQSRLSEINAMTWRQDINTSTSSISLAWGQFLDAHSDISHYFVSVGNSYSGSELTAGEPVRVDHSHAESSNVNGKQSAAISLSGTITDLKHPYLFVSIWAVNGVGLQSARLHATFEISNSSTSRGTLVQQRCSPITCKGHCSCDCGQPCTEAPTILCNDVTENNPNMEVEVIDVLDLHIDDISAVTDVDNIATQSTFGAVWRLITRQGLEIKWFEWSVGDDSSSSTEPAGVFDTASENVWFDVGQANHTVAVLSEGRKLVAGSRYYLFIRAWYNSDTYAVFRSDGILPDFTPPRIASTNKIKDLSTPHSTKDTDYVTDMKVSVSWKGVFLDTEMSHYQVFLSTYPGGDFVHVCSHHAVIVPAEDYLANFSDCAFQHGLDYYTNVRAFNKAGLNSLKSSDRFRLDRRIPRAGVVHDGTGLNDVEYQSLSTLVSASWHGFVDMESYIDHYQWCVGLEPGPDNDIMPCIDVGIRLAAATSLSVPLINGVRYYSKVFAVDAAGLRSQIVSSDGFIVDTTPPEPNEILLGNNLIQNPSFETTEENNYTVTSWNLESAVQFRIVTSPDNIAKDGRSFLSLYGSLSQTFNTTPGCQYQIVLFASHNVRSHNLLVNQEGQLEAPGVNRVFRFYDKPSHACLHPHRVQWHQHVFFFIARKKYSTVKISSLGRFNRILLDNIQVRPIRTRLGSADGSVKVHTQFIQSWSSVQANWHFVDRESPILEYRWAIGTSNGGTQMLPFTSVGMQTQACTTDLNPVHSMNIYVTVTARNAAGHIAVATSDPLMVDLTEPLIAYVLDGDGKDDIDFTTDDRFMTFTWSASDPESGIEYCEWSLGSKPGLADVLPNSEMPANVTTITTSLPRNSNDQRLFVAVICFNHAGLSSQKVTDGFTVVTEPPSSLVAVVYINVVSESPYPTHGGYQSQRHSLRGSWQGFSDPFGITFYECHLASRNSVLTTWVRCGVVSQTHADWSGLKLEDAVTYCLSVRAVNHAGLRSEFVSRNFTVESFKPRVAATTLITSVWLEEGVVNLKWDGLFSSSSPVVYEVSLGSIPGGSDIMQWVETTESGIRVSPLTPSTDYFLTVTAVNAAGLSQTVIKRMSDG